MNKLENLIIKHAEYSDLKSELKRKISAELSKHKYNEEFEGMLSGKDALSEGDIIYGTCGNHTYQAVKMLNRDSDGYGAYQYDEILNMYACEHCLNARELKLEMSIVGTKLGQIRGAITRAGRNLNRVKQDK